MKISFPAGIDFTTFTALPEVQQMSERAFTSAEELTYVTTTAPGCAFRYAARSAPVIMSAIGQPASSRGSRTVFSGERIAALSAMKWTPQKTITSAVVFAASCESPSESPVMSAISCTSSRW